VQALKRLIARIDDYQQRRRVLAFPFAVVKKFGDDQAGNLAALIAYYGFLSIFPLMVVMVAVLGFVLRGNADLQGKVIGSALAQFPVIGEQLRNNIKGLTGSGAGVALGVGTVGALWAGLGVTQAAQNAFNSVWNVPRRDRPNFVESRLRGLIMLAVLGVLTLASTFVSGVGTAEGGHFFWLGALGLSAALALNLALYMVAFRVLTDVKLSWGDVLPGAAFGAVMWTLLQSLGGYIVQHQLKNASALYGTFGFILALLGWIYLGAQVTLYAAEINVVRKKRLWPRSIVQPPLTDADRRTLEHAAKEEERIREERIDVRIDEPAGDVSGALAEKAPAASNASPAKGNGSRPKPQRRTIGGLPAAGLGALMGLVFARPRRRTRPRA
jgi:YihY family inner membrane protein